MPSVVYAECHGSYNFMASVIMVSVVMLGVIILSVVAPQTCM
jgi:hypothetical protein